MKINVNLTKCLLSLNTVQREGEVFGSYYVTYSLSALLNETLSQSAFTSFFNESINELNLSIISVKNNIKSCRLSLSLPNTLIEALTIQCFGKCYITQEYNTVSASHISLISNDDIYTNIRRIETNTFNFKANQGILQLNSFLVKETGVISLNYGDIILLSERDLRLDWTNHQKAFCFAGPSISHKSLTDNCYNDNNNDPNPCIGSSFLCESPNCSPISSLKIAQTLGNLYINRIENPFIDLDYNYKGKYEVSKGVIYDKGVSFEPFVLASIEEMKASANEMQTDSIYILQLGKKYLQSQGNSFWTVISNPSFAYMRPWWLATFSLSLLTANSYEISGYLSPGLCPYHIQYNREDIYKVQSYLSSYFPLNNSIVSYIDEAYEKDPEIAHRNGSGFYDYEEDRPISEKWLTINLNQEGKLDVISNDISANNFILVALILSFIFAGFVGATVFMIFKAAVMITYEDTWLKAHHSKNYISFVNQEKGFIDERLKKKKKKIDVSSILQESSFSNFMEKVPRLSAFVGFYSLNLVRKYFIDSVAEFLGFLMNPYLDSESEKANKGIGEAKYMVMRERTLKNYYEKFCFLNGLTEKQLSDPENLKKFEVYGYELLEEDEALSKAFTKMQLLEEVPELDKASLTNQDSLELFISTCVKATNAETDNEFVDEFIEKFNLFCDKYRLTRKEVRPDLLINNIKYKFGLKIIPRKKLIRKIIAEKISVKSTPKFSFGGYFKNLALKIVTFGRYIDKNSLQGKFLIDEGQLNYHFDILQNPKDSSLFVNLDLEKSNELKGKEGEVIITKKEVINKMIYHSYWYYWIMMDVVMIFIQQLVTAICIIPFFCLVLLQEITYAPYSIIDPLHLITVDDLMQNPWQIPGNIEFFNLWNIVIISICVFFMGYSFLDCLLYFW